MKFSKHHIVFFGVVCLLAINFFCFKENGIFWKLNILILLVYLVVLYVAVTRIRLNYFLNTINSGKEKGISLTFDDGPNTDFTEKILDILKVKNVKASFFIIGKNIAGNEAILKRIDKEGHLVGNHSFSHLYWYNSLLPKKIKADINKANDAIFEVLAKKPRYFRTPFGLTSPNIAKALENNEYISIGWDFRSFDTMAKDEEKLLNKLKTNAKQCSIVLLHDNNNITLAVLERFIDYCQENGIEIVSLDKMIGEKAYN